jgi:hypothetical protein
VEGKGKGPRKVDSEGTKEGRLGRDQGRSTRKGPRKVDSEGTKEGRLGRDQRRSTRKGPRQVDSEGTKEAMSCWHGGRGSWNKEVHVLAMRARRQVQVLTDNAAGAGADGQRGRCMC